VDLGLAMERSGMSLWVVGEERIWSVILGIRSLFTSFSWMNYLGGIYFDISETGMDLAVFLALVLRISNFDLLISFSLLILLKIVFSVLFPGSAIEFIGILVEVYGEILRS
jgi:hypothetical protein